MPKTRVQKEQTVQELTDKLNKSNSVVFADYQQAVSSGNQQAGTSGSKGMTMSELAELRSQLQEVSAEFIVTKNNILKVSLQNAGLEVKDEKVFSGPIATLFAYGDEITPLKILTKSFKDLQKGLVKAGIVNGEILNDSQVNKLAELPSKDELRAKVVGALGAPLYGIVGVLQANLRNLVYALDQIRIQKGGE